MRVRRHHHWPPGYNYGPEPPRGRLLLFIAAAFYAPAAAGGVCLLTGLPYLPAVLLTVGAIAAQLLLHQERHAAYWPLTLTLLLLTAYGLFGFSPLSAAAAGTSDQTAASLGGLRGFIAETIAQNSYALCCWFVALLIQFIIYLSCPPAYSEYDFWE